MAKKRRKRSVAIARAPRRTVRRRAAPRRSYRRRSGGTGGMLPPKDDLLDIGGAAVYGYLEKAAVKDPKHFLASIPKPVDALGYTGNVALMAWIAYKISKNKYVGHIAKGTLAVAAYKLGRRGESYKEANEGVDVSGVDDDGGEYVDMQGLEASLSGDEDDGE